MNMNHTHYDVVVIGGGPAGSSLATLLVRQGHTVLLLEREKFPRFHVGESLLPGTQLIWEKLGIAEPMQHLGHTFKYGGDFRIGLDPNKSEYESTLLHFYNFPRHRIQQRPYAYQVERSEFDLFLLNHARQQGVTVFEEATVKEVLWEGDKATGVCWRTKEGAEYMTQAGCVADCSGRHALIARSRKFLIPDKTIRTSAVFGHFKNVTRDPGIRQGYFNGYFLENGWMWLIPLHSDIMSVGVVMNEPGSSDWNKKSPEEILLTYINRYKFIRERFEEAEQFSKVRMLRGLSYASERAAGDGWILVGDANFFVDPLYSSGVHIAFHTSEKAAEAIDGFLKNNRSMKFFQRYERWSQKYQFHVFTTMRLIYKMLQHRVAIEGYVKLTGKYSNHWDNPILRRLAMWGNGYFDEYHSLLYSAWAFSGLLIGIGQFREKVLKKPTWDTYTTPCSDTPLQIRKSADLLDHTKNSGSISSPIPVNSESYPEQWVVPRDVSTENENSVPLAQTMSELVAVD
jgi:flavin-dependent dehydrogenase